MPALESGTIANSLKTPANQKAVWDTAAAQVAVSAALATTVYNAGVTNPADRASKKAQLRVARLTDLSTRAATRKTAYDTIYTAEAAALPASAVNSHATV